MFSFKKCSFIGIQKAFMDIPNDIHFFKVNNGNTSTMCEICPELTIK